MSTRVTCSAIAMLAIALFACNGSDSPERLTREDLIKPETCKGCHRRHYEQWSASMHAYASKDPVFRAMNARGQREQPELGKFCVNCHAPMAVHEGMTKDGTNLDELPDYLQGVTCYFCHNVEKVKDDHNNKLQLSDDITMRGAVRDPDPVDSKTHDTAYSELHDGLQLESSPMCGGCHDIVTKSGVHLERTFEEWRNSFASQPPAIGSTPGTCGSCHMRADPERTFIANAEGASDKRIFHDHLFPAVDVPLSDNPFSDALKSAIEDCELPQSIGKFSFGLNLDPMNSGPGAFTITLETAAGHSQPSGASQDRRVWLEVTAFDQGGAVIAKTDEFKDDGSEMHGGGNPPAIFHDSIFDAKGEPVHMFWEAVKSPEHEDGFLSRALPFGAKTTMPNEMPPSHSVSVPFTLLPGQVAERFEVKLRMRPMGLDVLQDLVDSGDLDAGVLEKVPTFTVYSSTIKHLKGGGEGEYDDPTIPGHDCDRSRCMIEPLLDECKKD